MTALRHFRLRYQSGSEDLDFESFYRLNARAVMAFCAHYGLSPQDAADVTADSFLRALSSLESYDQDLGTSSAWLFGIVRNVIGLQERRSRRDRLLQERLFEGRLQMSSEDVADYFEFKNNTSRLLGALAHLPENERQILLDQRLHDIPYETLSAEHGVPVPALRKRVSRTVADLRAALQESNR